MTFAELKAEMFRRLEESATAPVFWTEAEVETALNNGYLEISDATEWYERWLTVDLLADRPYYDLRTVVPRTVLRVGAAFNETTNRWLTPSSVSDLVRSDRRWERRVGTPERFLLRSQWWLGYWPRTSSESGTIKQYYTALPDLLADDDDEPGFPVTCHYGLVEYALTELWAQEGETDKALAGWTVYRAYEKALQDWVDGRVSVPLVHGHGEDTRLATG